MARFNRSPSGLQSLLDNQNLGRNPSELAETVIPAVEMDRFFEANLLRTEATSISVGNWDSIGDQAAVTVPDGEIWQPLNLACIVSNSAATSALWKIGLGIDLPDNSSGVLRTAWLYGDKIGSTIFGASLSALSSNLWVYNFPWKLIAPSGTTFRAQILDLSLAGGTSGSCTFYCNFIKLSG